MPNGSHCFYRRLVTVSYDQWEVLLLSAIGNRILCPMGGTAYRRLVTVSYYQCCALCTPRSFERPINKLHPDDEKRGEFDYRWRISSIL
jgi:hypothetical protein